MTNRPIVARAYRIAMVSLLVALPGYGAALANDARPDKSGYTLFNPTPDSALRDFAPDRPAKSTGATTVDAGRVLFELETVNFSTLKLMGTRTDTWVGPNPTARIGLTNSIEVQLNWASFIHQRTKDGTTGDVTSGSGNGDIFVRGKLSVWGNEGGPSALAIVPWVKAGTAPESVGGNRATEGGVIVPVSFDLQNNVALTFNAEWDRLKNATNDSYHNQFIGTVGLTGPVVKDLALTVELWSQTNADPSGTVRQYSFDTALAWSFQPNLQLDVGANIGLNHDTPALQIYTGLAQRF